MYKKKPFFIVFEGVEGCGKSYQSKRLAKNLWNTRRPEHQGYKAVRESQLADGVIKNRWEKLI